ncbi:hypothetical protein C8R48DRAFT_465505 [Suillus tomentosus]|nr:hypothetical protein C8R48DRAFT_465505 [Suillus tomentosus]
MLNGALCIVVFRKLLPITLLTKREFLAAWWQMVKCKCFFLLVLFVHAFHVLTGHRALWKRGIYHCNVSLSNIMGCRLHGQFIGVLNDYNLSSF